MDLLVHKVLSNFVLGKNWNHHRQVAMCCYRAFVFTDKFPACFILHR